MHVSVNTNLRSIIEENIFQKALSGKEGEEMQELQKKIDLIKRKFDGFDRSLASVIQSIAKGIDESDRELGINIPDHEKKEILKSVLNNLANSVR